MLLLIMGNCISLALYDPLQDESSQHNHTLQQVGAHAALSLWLRLLTASIWLITQSSLLVCRRTLAHLSFLPGPQHHYPYQWCAESSSTLTAVSCVNLRVQILG